MSRKSESLNRTLTSPVGLIARLTSVLVIAALLVTAVEITQPRWALAAGNYASAVAADLPVGYWRLDEATGTTAADFSGTHTNPLTYTGGYTLGTNPGAISGDPDSAVALNGTTGAVTATKAPTAGTTNWSLEAWVNPSTLPQVGMVAYNGQENSNGYGFAIGTSALGSGSHLIGVVGGVGTFDSGYSFAAPSTWYHVVMTRDTTTIRFYVNGVVQATTSALVPVAPGARFSLGSAYTSTPTQVYPLAGSVDEGASYNTLLSAGRIQAHFIEGGSATSGYGNWVTSAPAGPPTTRFEPAMGWDADHSKVVLFGGKNSSGTAIQETWTWDGTTWTKLTPATQPPARWGAQLVYDTSLAKMVLFGGKAGNKALRDTWTWDGTTWASVSPTTSPSARLEYGLSYDAANSVVVLFGGTTGSAALQDTYTFQGTNWTLKAPAAKPSIRSGVAMAYDDATSNTVLFGGVSGTTYSPETWTWNGTNWTLKAPTAAPSLRANSGLAYNPVTATEVLVGGVNGSSYFGDTWTWDGTNWSLQSPGTSPTVRAGAGFAYNGVSGNDALFGGLSGATFLNDTLAWKTPPAVPTVVTAVAGNAQATISWTAPPTGGSAITGYTVVPYIGTTPGTASNPSASPTTVTGLTNGTSYTFKVLAKNAIGNGPVGVSNAVTPAQLAGAPTGVIATPGNGQASVSWTAPANGGSPITAYKVTPYIGGTPGTVVTVSGTPPVTNATVPSLVNGTTYTFQVYAVNGIGNGPAGTSSAITVGAPSAPNSVVATGGVNQAGVTWVAPAANGSAITGYTVTAYIGSQANNRVDLGPAATSATVNGLLGSTAYTLQVVATNSFGTGPAGISNAVTPTGTTSTYVSTVMGDTPQAYWRLDDPSGTLAADSSGNGRDGTINGTVTLSSPGLLASDPDTATVFDGSTAYVSAATIPTLQGSSARSVELWFKTTSTSQQPLFDSGNTGTTGQAFIIGLTQQSGMANSPAQNTPGVALLFWGNDVYLPGLNLADGAVHHLVVTVSGTTVRVFVDGVAPQGYVRTGTTWSAIGSQPFTLGSAPNTASNPVWSAHSRATIDGTGSTFFSGTLDEPAVYVGALTSTQVLAHEVASGWVPVAPTSLTATPAANQVTVTWASNTAPGAFAGYTVTAYNGAQAANAVAVAPSATSAVVSGLQGAVAYTFRVTVSNQFGTATATSSAATPTGPATTYASTVRADSPSVYWRLGDAGTTIAADSSGNARPGKYSGTYTLGAAGALPNDPDKAFTNTSGLVSSAGANPGLPINNTPRSIEAWVNTTQPWTLAVAGYGAAVCCSPPTQFLVRIRGGDQVELFVSGNSVIWNAPYVIANGSWHQVAVTWDGTYAIAYLDGQSLGAQTTFALQTTLGQNGLVVGRDVTDGSNTFTGTIDEVAVYTTALSSAQVLNHFNQSGNSLPAAPTGVGATGGLNQATVTWTASPTNLSPVTGYLVTAYKSGVAQNSIGTTASAASATISGLQGTVAYTFGVVAINNFGVGVPSTQSAAVTPTGLGVTYASTVIGDVPALYLRLGEGSGSGYAADSSGAGRLSTYQGSVTLGAGSALLNDADHAMTASGGIAQYALGAGLPTGNSARSIEGWINTTSTATQAVAGYGAAICCSPPSQFLLRVRNGNQVELFVSGNAVVWNVPYSIATGSWHQVVVTWDGSLAIAYVDGTSLGAQSTFALVTSLDQNGLIVGRDVTDGSNAFAGSIDEVAVYATALTATQVENHFTQSGNSAPAAPTGVSASPGLNRALVSWTAPATNPSPVTGYVVTSYLNGTTAGLAVGAAAGATSATVYGLKGASNYTFDVVAVNSFGFGTHSAMSTSISPTGVTPTYASTVLGDAPNLYARFSEPSGSPIGADSSGGATRSGNYAGTFSLGTPGAIVGDSDPSFATTAGSLQYLSSTGLPTGNASRSIEAWFNTTSTATQAIAGYGPTLCCNPPTQFVVRIAGGNQIEVDIAAGGGQMFAAGRSIADGYWHAVVATWNGTTLTTYLDGVSLGTSTPGALTTYTDQNGFTIGRDGWDTNGIFTGSIDDVALYPTVLTATQVTAHYTISSAGLPAAPTSLVVVPSTNSAAISWTQPGGSSGPITAYQVTPVLGGIAEPVQNFPNPASGVNVTGLRGGGSYTFQVAAINKFGVGAVATSSAATVNAPAAGPGLGQDLYLRESGSTARGNYNDGFVSQTNVPAMSQWTVEGFMWGFQSSGITTSNMAWGLLGGSSSGPSPTAPVAGINFNIGALGGPCCDTSFVFPGGTILIGNGLPASFGSSTPVHYALTYDGTTVRGFVNGALVGSVVTAAAAAPAAPGGFYDQTALLHGYFDEFRISDTARYLAAFAPPTASFDKLAANTRLLYDFSEYQISKLPSFQAAYSPSGAYTSVVRSGAFSDSSGHGNHADVLVGYNHCCSPSDTNTLTYTPYILAPGVTADEVAGGGSPWECSCHFPEGHYPIDTATGEFWHSFTDVTIPGRGPAINLTRTYSSHNAAIPSRFGFGWADGYNENLTTVGSLTTVHAGNGSTVTFTNNAGVFSAPPQVLATLSLAAGVYTFTDKGKNQYLFNATGQLTKLQDSNGEATLLAYATFNAASVLSTVTDPASRVLTFSYVIGGLGHNLVDHVVDSSRTVTYGYDPATEDLLQVTDIGGGISKFTYDSSHQLLTMRDPNCTAAGAACNGGNGVVNVYTSGLVTQQTDYMGRVTHYDYSSVPYSTKVTDPKGFITLYEYLGGFLLSTTREDQNGANPAVTTYGYDPNTIGATSITDPSGATATTTRDAQANVLTVTDALGRTTTYADYNTFNEPLTVTDAASVPTTRTFDTNGNLTQTSTPLAGSGQNQIVSYLHGNALHPGDVTQSTDANGKIWNFGYDSNGNQNSSTDPLTDQTTYTFDSLSRLISVVTPKGNVTGGTPSQYTTTYSANPWGQPLTVTDPLNHQAVNVYDADGNLTSNTDANLHQTIYKYNFDGERTETDRADASTLKSGYDANGNVQTQTDGLTHQVTYAYDALNQRTSMTDVFGRTTTYGYDVAGNLTSSRDALGRITTYRYDIASQLLEVAYSDGRTPNVTYSYDALGRRLAMRDGTGTSSYSYDSLGRLTQSTTAAGAQLQYGYDLKGQLTSLVYPGGVNTVGRTYDDAGRLHTVQDWLAHTTTFKFDPNSNLYEQDYPNSTIASLSYNAADQLTGITDALSGSNFLNFNYSRDSIGQLAADGSKGYTYDATNRLETYTNASAATYAYDSSDRLTSIAISGGGNTSTLAYDTVDQLQSLTITNGPTQISQTTFGFDGVGNRTSALVQGGSTTTLAYDQANRLVAYGSNASYSYNGDGLRMSKTVFGASEPFTWDVAEGLALMIADGNTSYVTGVGGLPLEQIGGSGVFYYHTDQLGDIRALTDPAGVVQQSYDYDPYGNIIGSVGSVSNPLQYAGQFLDSESGLYYLRARYFDPLTAQFITRDPLAEVTHHAYAFDADNPMNSIDDSGLAGPPDCGALLEKIKQALYEFNKDYSNQKRETDAGNLAQWAGHDLELRQRQHRLQELLAQWNRGNCGEKAQFKNDKEAQAVIRDASEAARRELPTPFKAMGGGLGPAAAAGAIMAFLAWLFSKLKAGIGPVRRPVFPVIPVAPIL